MRWLALFHFLIWCSMTGLWTWYTHMYAETVGGATPNATDYKARVVLIFTNSPKCEWHPDAEKYDEGTKEAAKILTYFPVTLMISSFLVTSLKVYQRVSKERFSLSFTKSSFRNQILITMLQRSLSSNYFTAYWSLAMSCSTSHLQKHFS